MAMHVGICEITIRLHQIKSLKGKRQITQSVVKNLRNKFNVSAAEVDNLDDKTLFGLGLSSVSGSKKVIDRIFNGVLNYLERDRRLDVEKFEQEYL